MYTEGKNEVLICYVTVTWLSLYYAAAKERDKKQFYFIER